LIRFLVRNWHLKLGAVALATVLYTGLVFSGSFTTDTIAVPITTTGQPAGNWFLLNTTQLGSVELHYRVATDAAREITPDSFVASVDLSKYDLEQPGQPQSLRIDARSIIDGVTVLDQDRNEVTVALDQVTAKNIPVRLDRGVVPDGLEIDDPQLGVREVQARGPKSLLGQVDHALARVRIDPSGIDFDHPVDLLAVDVDGKPVESIDLNPATVTVKINVRTIETSKSVPIRGVLQGAPANGYALAGVRVEPAGVSLRGVPAALTGIVDVATAPIDLEALKATQTFKVALVLPDGATLSAGEPTTASVTVAIAPASGTRTFALGVICRGAPAGSSCLPDVDQLAVTLSGPTTVLAGLDPAQITPVVDASGLGPGQHQLNPSVGGLAPGVQVVSIVPASVTVTISSPSTPAPTPSPSP
jgi:YbbR domain-containing protein